MAKAKSIQKAELNFDEIGRAGLNRWGGSLLEEYLPDLRGDRGIKIYREMKDNDPVIGAMLFAFQFLARQVNWFIEPVDQSEPEKARAEFLNGALFDDMETHWNDILSEVFSMLWAGWSWLEIVYKVRGGESADRERSSRFKDGKIGWRKWALRGQDTLYEWVFNKDYPDDLEGMVQQLITQTDRPVVPLAKSILFRTRVEKGNPEGRSMLRNAYRPYYYSKRIEEYLGIGIERDLAGLPMLTPPEGVDLWNPSDSNAVSKRASAEKLVRSIRRDEQEGIVLPHGWELKLLGTGGRREFDLVKVLTYYDQRKAMVMLADFILLGHDKVGSFALSSDKTSLFSAALGGVLDIVAETINREAFPKLLRLNNMLGEKNPNLKHGDIETANLKEVSDFVNSMTGAGIDLTDEATEKYLRQQAKLPVPDFDDLETQRREREGGAEQVRTALEEMQNQIKELRANATPAALAPASAGANGNQNEGAQ